jgi:PAS domain S-box-containing protein
MTRNTRLVLLLGVAAVAVMTVGNTLLAVRNVAALQGTMTRVMRSQSVLEALDQLLSTMQDAETGERGYIITGLPVYLTPYHAARGTLPDRLHAVDSLTRAEPDQQAVVPVLRGDVDNEVAQLEQTIALRAGGDAAAAIAAVNTGRSKADVDSIRARLATMQRNEDLELQHRRDEAVASRDEAEDALWLAGLLQLVTLATAAWLVMRQLKREARAAADLYAQKEQLRVTLASIGDAVITTDPAGAITSVNAVAAALTAWPEAQAIGEPLDRVFRIVNAATRQPVADPVERALREGAIVGLANHTVLIARDGTECPIDDSAAPIRDARNHVVGAVLVFRDITERYRNEQQLRDADQHKDEFLALLAHELRNPLAPLRNALAVMRLSGHDAASVAETGGIMERQLEQMVHLVDDLLDVSRITQNRLALRRAPVDVSSIIHSALETCGPPLEDARHTLTLTLPAQPLYIDADRTRLAQTLSNLINNAIKYTDRGGRIWVAATADDRDVVITVRDSGIGVPADMFDRIFDMFTQVDRSLERSRGGLGIGLPLVRHIVTMHGGSIRVRSPGAGLGSEFIVRLPAIPAPAPASPDAATDNGIGKRTRRILVADDNADNADTLAMMLRMMGHDVCVARDGDAALYEAEHFAPDIALLDIGMPKLNGYEVARAVRAAPWGQDMVLVALTGWGQDEDRRRSSEAGFDHHMVKPVEIPTLEAVLGAHGRAP